MLDVVVAGSGKFDNVLDGMDIWWFSVLYFKQKTAYDVRISDWSSDVCSSDLPPYVSRYPAIVWRLASICVQSRSVKKRWSSAGNVMPVMSRSDRKSVV